MMAFDLSFPEAAERVKEQLNILDVVGRFVSLKKRGRSHLGLCPFHNERTPSFNVSPEKGFFKCFGCGEGGDAISFLMKIENKGYGDVIREQAEEMGIAIRYSDDREAQQKHAQKLEERERQWDVLKNAAQWFNSQLQQAAARPVRDYLQQRGYGGEVVSRFQLGYAPESWDALNTYLLSASPHVAEDIAVLERTSLAAPRTNGHGYYDRFRHRLMIPIHDTHGHCIGFGGRALGEEQQPKYLNSSESVVYQKSEVLYGLHLAKERIRKSKRAVVMEGYFDVIGAHLAGLEEAVATCGTALTEAHVKLLLKTGVETLYLCFDEDKAGRNAALSAIERLEPWVLRQSLKLRVLRLPAGKDPDEYFKTHTLEDFERLMQAAPDGLRFQFDCALDGLPLHSPQGQLEGTQRLMPLLSRVKHPVIRAQLLSHYAEVLHLQEEALRQELNRHEGRKPSATKQHASAGPSRRYDKKSGYGHRPPAVSEDFSRLRQGLLQQQSLPIIEQRLFILALADEAIYRGLRGTLQGFQWQSKLLGWLWQTLADTPFDAVQETLKQLWQQAIQQERAPLAQCIQHLIFEQEKLLQQRQESQLAPPDLLEMVNQSLRAWQKRYHQEALSQRNRAFRESEQQNGNAALQPLDSDEALVLHYDILETQSRFLK